MSRRDPPVQQDHPRRPGPEVPSHRLRNPPSRPQRTCPRTRQLSGRQRRNRPPSYQRAQPPHPHRPRLRCPLPQAGPSRLTRAPSTRFATRSSPNSASPSPSSWRASKVDDLVKRVKAGEKFDSAAKALGLEPKTSDLLPAMAAFPALGNAKLLFLRSLSSPATSARPVHMGASWVAYQVVQKSRCPTLRILRSSEGENHGHPPPIQAQSGL